MGLFRGLFRGVFRGVVCCVFRVHAHVYRIYVGVCVCELECVDVFVVFV